MVTFGTSPRPGLGLRVLGLPIGSIVVPFWDYLIGFLKLWSLWVGFRV